jgi:signal transduction histidine kinase
MILPIFLLLGISIINIVVLGFIVYSANPKSVTNRAFLFIAVAAVLFGIFNFLYNQPYLNNLALWFLRIHMFFAVLYAFSIFYLYYVFPGESVFYSKFFKFFLVPWVVFVSILTLTPLVFERIISFKPDGTIEEVKTNFGIALFGITVTFFLLSFFVGFIQKIYQTKDKLLRFQYILIFLGAFITFGLHIYFNFVLPNFNNNTKYTNLAALYSFPFILFTALAIFRYRFLGIRVILTDLFILILLVLSTIQILSAVSFIEIILRLLILILILIFGVITIRSIRKEIEYREKLEELNKLKSEFLSFASHQVKAPMAVVKGYAELIVDGIENVPEQAKDFARKIKESVDNLLVLIDEFMDYRKIEEGKMEMEFEEVEIVSFVRKIAENARLLAEKKNLKLIFENSLVEGYVEVDKIRFSQVIQNLIDNAIKYTNVGFVKISVDKKQNSAVICVSDSGLGMSKELQTKLFGQFVRDPSIKKEIRGTGLGLYIAKYIVEAHKGKIWAESEGEGKGSRFYVSIPLKL